MLKTRLNLALHMLALVSMQSDQNASFRVNNKQSASKYILCSLCSITSICIKHAIEKKLNRFFYFASYEIAV